MLYRNEDDEFTGELAKQSHPVMVIDSELKQYVREHLTQYDHIYIEGHLHYKSVELENGKKRRCGNIIPIHIEKTE